MPTASNIPPAAREASGGAARRILVVDDDEQIRDLLTRYLGQQGFAVLTVGDGAGMRGVLESEAVDLVLLDLGLPGEDGLDLTRALRARWQGPIIIVSGRGETIDRVVGLELGADDYVTKPFDLRELLARIRSLLRRSASPAGNGGPDGERPAAVEFAGFRLDPLSRTLRDPGGIEVSLTSGEYALLDAFLEAPGRVLTRDHLMNRIHGREAGPFDRAIDVQIGRLRRKIETDPANPALIKSVRGSGYVFAAQVQRSGGG